MTQLQISKDFALPLDVAGEAIAILATRGAGKSYTSAVLIEELRAADVQTVTIDPTGVYWGLRSSSKGTGDGLPIIVLGGAHGDVSLAETAGKLIADLVVDTGQSLVLDLSDFESDGAQCRFMTDFAERLYRRKARTRTTLHLIVDEADEFAPQRPQKNEARMVGAMAKLVRRGRSRGIGLTLITQRSAALNKNLLDLVETLLLMRMLGPRDRDAAAGWISHKNLNDEHGVLASLPALPTGTAWVWSPLRNVLQKVAMRRIQTFDSYVTPKPGEVRVEPKALAPVDIEKLGQQIKATAEKAKADDPAALRKRITELEREKATAAQYSAADLDANYIRGRDDGFEAGRVAGGSQIWKAMEDAMSLIRLPEAPARKPVVAQTQAIRDTPVKHLGQFNAHRQAGNSEVGGGGLRRILTALAQRNGLSTRQVGIRAGLSSGSGSFRTYLAKARTSGWIEGDRNRLNITDVGRAALGDYKPLPTGAALLQYWLNDLGNSGAARILQVVAEAYPRALTKEQVGEMSGMSCESGSFRTYLSKLRTLELISGRGELKASDDLF